MGSVSENSNDASLHCWMLRKGKPEDIAGVNRFYILAYLREQIPAGVKLFP